jgi:DUF1009 family protein
MIGLIFGETDFPKQILKKIKNKRKYLIIDLTKKRIFKKDNNSYPVFLGQFGKILSILKENKCKKVLFAGKVKKPNFSKLRIDFKGIYYMPQIVKSSKLGDAAILKEIINIFKKEKITTVSSLIFNPELTLKKGYYSKVKPNREDKADIKKAITTLDKLGNYNFSQGVVVKDRKVIAVEGKSGTQKMLKKCKIKKTKNKGVLVKFPKKKQDLRIDLPTVGLSTLKQCKTAGLKGIVLKSKQNVFLDKKKCINFANQNKMYIAVK